MADTPNAPIANPNSPDVREPEADGLKGRKRDYPVPDDSRQAPTAPKTGGAPLTHEPPLKSPVSDRSAPGAARQDTTTPRPTDEPITGGKGSRG